MMHSLQNTVSLSVENRKPYRRILQLTKPINAVGALIKLIQVHLAASLNLVCISKDVQVNILTKSGDVLTSTLQATRQTSMIRLVNQLWDTFKLADNRLFKDLPDEDRMVRNKKNNLIRVLGDWFDMDVFQWDYSDFQELTVFNTDGDAIDLEVIQTIFGLTRVTPTINQSNNIVQFVLPEKSEIVRHEISWRWKMGLGFLDSSYDSFFQRFNVRPADEQTADVSIPLTWVQGSADSPILESDYSLNYIKQANGEGLIDIKYIYVELQAISESGTILPTNGDCNIEMQLNWLVEAPETVKN